MSINPHAHSRYSWKGKKFVQKSHICSILLSASLQVPCPYPFAICLHGSQSGDPGKKRERERYFVLDRGIFLPAKYQCTWPPPLFVSILFVLFPGRWENCPFSRSFTALFPALFHPVSLFFNLDRVRHSSKPQVIPNWKVRCHFLPPSPGGYWISTLTTG